MAFVPLDSVSWCDTFEGFLWEIAFDGCVDGWEAALFHKGKGGAWVAEEAVPRVCHTAGQYDAAVYATPADAQAALLKDFALNHLVGTVVRWEERADANDDSVPTAWVNDSMELELTPADGVELAQPRLVVFAIEFTADSWATLGTT